MPCLALLLCTSSGCSPVMLLFFSLANPFQALVYEWWYQWLWWQPEREREQSDHVWCARWFIPKTNTQCIVQSLCHFFPISLTYSVLSINAPYVRAALKTLFRWQNAGSMWKLLLINDCVDVNQFHSIEWIT